MTQTKWSPRFPGRFIRIFVTQRLCKETETSRLTLCFLASGLRGQVHAEIEVGKPGRAPENFLLDVPRSDCVSSGELTDTKHRSRSRPTQRMRCMSAPDEPDRRSNAAGNIPKSKANRSRQSHRVEEQSHQTLFCRLTPELSRPVSGWRTCASVA